MARHSFAPADYALLVIYMLLSVAVSAWSAYRKRQPPPLSTAAAANSAASDSYFLAGRSANAFIVAVSLLRGVVWLALRQFREFRQFFSSLLLIELLFGPLFDLG